MRRLVAMGRYEVHLLPYARESVLPTAIAFHKWIERNEVDVAVLALSCRCALSTGLPMTLPLGGANNCSSHRLWSKLAPGRSPSMALPLS